MAWRVWAEMLTTSDMTGTRVFHPYKPTNSIILKGCKIWVLASNDPTFTSLNMKIYSSNADSEPGKLLYTSSNSVAKASILTTENHGMANIFFEFLDDGGNTVPGVPLRGGTTYNFVLNATGASGFNSTDTFIAWKTAWPDPEVGTVAFPDLAKAGYSFVAVSADV